MKKFKEMGEGFYCLREVTRSGNVEGFGIGNFITS